MIIGSIYPFSMWIWRENVDWARVILGTCLHYFLVVGVLGEQSSAGVQTIILDFYYFSVFLIILLRRETTAII